MPNRLADEPSPYLQQHKDNPVDWRPWGDEAFEEARRRDVPVFLSVGYATCHWCHVMAHESFEDPQVAALLNKHTVPVKVDREERPDVDDAYMAACQAMTGSGGWPLTVLLTPDRRPWFAGTYFPKEGRGGRIGMLELVPRLSEAWRSQRDEIEQSADHVVGHLQEAFGDAGGTEPGAPSGADASWLERAHDHLAKALDPEHGGFGRAPKFPSPHQVRFLLREHVRTGKAHPLAMATRTLHAMADGGIHDHVGGGFHRYSTDARWFLPHFEKMLYDQAGLLIAYVEAWQVTGDDRFREVAEGIVAYLARDLRHADGAFFSAEDADSEGEEGRFYVWSLDALKQILGDGANAFAAAFGATTEGTHRDEATGQPTGSNVLNLPRPIADTARRLQRDPASFATTIKKDLETLRHAREDRPRPLRDDKVLADWNGLAIGALASAGRALGRDDMVSLARDAATFVLDRMRGADGRLLHRWRDGAVDDDAFLDDHAFLAWGLLELHQADQDAAWIGHARTLADALLARFEAEPGGFTVAPRDRRDLVVNRREAYDGAIASGNSIAADVLWRLTRLTGEARYEAAAWRTVSVFAPQIERAPQAFTAMLAAVGTMLDGGREVVVAGPDAGADALLAVALRGFRPGRVVIRQDANAADAAPWLAAYGPVDGQAAAYVCRDHACQRPVTSPDELVRALARPRG